ncbi:hypothetical protein J31TS4_18260 [Paenibacillus sp. J31TS4]|uniref:pentapeptide repeat-containing protein n=1 Tax=Paenibacillus sp. J31TS4 TaxID=2807195 RepID=UPI001B24ED5A|nr:hypothetical protein [Paenibacillus sp. J31TS4]GIP38546.1 hypothetical protein J31TS4_18260 [Paenibacillus sp. J31TS4]
MQTEVVAIKQATKRIEAKQASIDGSTFECVGASRMTFRDVCLAGTRITDANLSDLEIDGAQLGGATIRNIGMPGPGHSLYDPEAKQRPLTFENCELTGSRISGCNLTDVAITDCEMVGLTINGIPVEELLRVYEGAAAKG